MVFNWSRAEISLYVLIIFYFFAGINHFIMPDLYIPVIPYDSPEPFILNLLAGFAEVVLAAGLVFKSSRKYAVYGIIALLIAFIPVHVMFIKEGSCFGGDICIPEWIAQVRLWIVHPLLGYWAWSQRTNKIKII